MKKYIVLGILVFVAIIGFNVTAQADLNDGLVAYYSFNGNANDESGNGNNGTVHGASLTEDRFGNTDSAYSFDGENDYIEVIDSTSLDISNQITISAWIKTTGTTEYSGVVCKFGPVPYSGDRNSYCTYVNNDSMYVLNTNYTWADGIGAASSSTTEIDDGSWHHVLGMYNGDEIKLFVDGVEENSSTYSSGILITDNPLIIGYDPYSGGDYTHRYFTGQIDDIRIYNRTLTESEIQELYAEGSICENSYNEGYNDGYVACQADPNCTGGSAATYNIWSNILTVPNLMIRGDSYNVKLKGPYNVISITPNN
jgi:hypothetical protein